MDRSRIMPKRQPGMSQLDYLWLNFGGRTIATEASEIPSDDVILSEKALTDLIQNISDGGIVRLKVEDDPDDASRVRLLGLLANGLWIDPVYFDREVHIKAFAKRSVTQVDIDNGCTYPINTPVISILLTNDLEFLLSTDELAITITGGETNTVATNVVNGVVQSNLKIDNRNNSVSVVELKHSTLGAYINLKLSERKSGIALTKEEDGLLATIPLARTSYNIKFENLTLAEYINIPYKDEGTLYFITDVPYIYLGTRRYGVNIEPGDAPVVSVVYDPEILTLSYKRADESDIRNIIFGPVAADRGGMWSKEQYSEYLKLKQALDGIVDVKAYVKEQVDQVGVTLEFGEVKGRVKPLHLKNGFGDIISTVDLETENYLSFAVNKKADLDDVTEAAKQGVFIDEGTQLLILTLTSEDKVYVDLSQLVDIYTAKNTRSINMTISQANEVSADLNISRLDKMLYVYADGVAAHVLIVRTPGKVTFYGKTQNDEDKLGEFEVGDTLIKTAFIEKSTLDTYKLYPPRKIDGKECDLLTNPFLLDVPYFILVYGTDTGDTSTSFTYNDYVSINPVINSLVLSPEPGNMLSRDANGYLYCSTNWKTIE